MREFKMICFSCKGAGSRGLVKFHNKMVDYCPDCRHALFFKYTEDKNKRGALRANRPDAEYGWKTSKKNDLDL